MSFSSRLLRDVPGIRYAFLDAHETAEFPYAELAPVKLVHGNLVHHYQGPQAERPHADAMFTGLAGHKMGVVTADCLPLLMASRDGRYVCGVHAGWRGTANGIIANSLALFRQHQVAPEEVVVACGPHIQPCCYEVSADFYPALLTMPLGDLARQYRDTLFPARQSPLRAEQAIAREADSRWFDLQAFARLALSQAGVREENMEWLGDCTYCTPHLLGSYRRRSHFPAAKTLQYSWIMREA